MRIGGDCFAKLPPSPAYRRLLGLLAAGDLVVLDGGIATELESVRRDQFDLDREPWGSWALRYAPTDVRDVHGSYVDAGCDVISTNTWSLIEMLEADLAGGLANRTGMPAWTELARTSIRLARDAIDDAGQRDRCAVAFAMNDDVGRPGAGTIVEVLTWVWDDDPPDLVLLETISRIPDAAMLAVIDTILETGLPVWVSFRRCRFGFCDALGAHRDADNGEAFGQALRDLEQRGVGALLLNCVRPDDLTDAISALRPFVELPLGVYPNIGRATPVSWEPGWRLTPEHYARLARGWHEEGAQIIGGCCGATPAHIEAVAALLKQPERASFSP